MQRTLALSLLALTTACAHRAPEPAAAQAQAAFTAQMQASAHERRHQSIAMLEGMLGRPASPIPAPGSPGH